MSEGMGLLFVVQQRPRRLDFGYVHQKVGPVDSAVEDTGGRERDPTPRTTHTIRITAEWPTALPTPGKGVLEGDRRRRG